MTAAFARHSVMPKKSDDSISPYLRRRLRKYEEVAPKPAQQLDKDSAEPKDPSPAKPHPKSSERT
jgi:hypothetical protein